MRGIVTGSGLSLMIAISVFMFFVPQPNMCQLRPCGHVPCESNAQNVLIPPARSWVGCDDVRGSPVHRTVVGQQAIRPSGHTGECSQRILFDPLGRMGKFQGIQQGVGQADLVTHHLPQPPVLLWALDREVLASSRRSSIRARDDDGGALPALGYRSWPGKCFDHARC